MGAKILVLRQFEGTKIVFFPKIYSIVYRIIMSSSTSAEQSKHELLEQRLKLEQRLNKAKKQLTIDTNNVASTKSKMDAAIAMYASAKSQLDMAKSQLDMSKKEAEGAETMLAEAKNRDAAVDNNNLEQTAAVAKQSDGSSTNASPTLADLSSTAAA